MRLRLRAELVRAAVLRPEPIVAFLVLVGAILFLLLARGERVRAPEPVEFSQVQPTPVQTEEVRLVTYDSAGLEAPSFRRIALPEAPAARLEAILAALREEMLGVAWPAELPVPTVYVESIARRAVAILDFRPEEQLSLSVAAEERLLRSVRETVLVNGADEIRFLHDGEASGVFLEHLAVPAALSSP